jgi:hypothetical protein
MITGKCLGRISSRRRALLVKVERRGPFVYYEIADAVS